MKRKTRLFSFALSALLLATPAYALAKGGGTDFSPLEKIEMKLPYSLTRLVDDRQNEESGKVVFNKDQFSIDGINLTKKGGVFTLSPLNASPGQAAVFGYTWSTSGIGFIKKGNLRFSIPKHSIKDNTNSYEDTLNTSFTTKERADELSKEGQLPAGTVLVMTGEDDDNVYVSNYVDLPAASSGYFEISYSNSEPTYEYVNHQKYPVQINAEVWNGDKKLDSLSLKQEFQYDLQAKIDSITVWQPELSEDEDWCYLTYSVTNRITPDPVTTSSYDLTYTGKASAKGDVSGDMKAEIVSFKHLGDKIDPTAKGLHSGGDQYGLVVVRIPKSEWYENKRISVSLSLDNKLNAYDITPSHAEGSKDFYWTLPRFELPFGHFNTFKYGNVEHPNSLGEYARYDLEDLQEGKVSSLGGINYELYSLGYPFPWTVDGDPYKPENYGKKPVTYLSKDDKVWIVDPETMEETELGKEDFKFNSISLDFSFEGVEKKDGSPVIDQKTQNFIVKQVDEDPTITIYVNGVKTSQKLSEWKRDKRYKNGRLYLDNCYDVRVEFSNAYWSSRYDMNPEITLLNSKKVMDLIKDKEYVLVKNHTNLTVSQNGKEIISIDKEANDRVRRTIREGHLSKEAISAQNNAAQRFYSVNWKVDMSETFTTGKNQIDSVEQNGGVFYDLLPYGNHYVDGSAIVTSNGKEISDYSVKVSPNHEGTGRDLLIVKVNERGKDYGLIYTSTVSWDSIVDISRNITNPVVYKTGNDSIGSGMKKPSLFNLPEEKSKVYLEAKDSTYNDALINSLSGLTKTVKAQSDSCEKINTKVSSGENYVYTLRYQNSKLSSSKNNVLYDNIENYSDGKIHSQWHGTLVRIDSEQPKIIGCDPKVYVSYEYADLSSKSSAEKANWIPEEKADLSKAKAVKIDCSKGIDGKDFVLDKGKSISAGLVMKAPTYVKGSGSYPKTYNNVYIGTDVISQRGTESFFIHQDYTSVSHYVAGNVKINKVSLNGEPIKGMEFTLQGTSEYGNDVLMKGISNSKGEIEFNKVETGKYKIFESKTNDDWLINRNVYDVTVDNEGNPSEITVKNQRRYHSDIRFTKVDDKTDYPIGDTKFVLYGTSDYGNKIYLESSSSENGSVVFNDVEKGSYTLMETKPNKDYVHNLEKISVVVADSGFSMSGGTSKKNKNGYSVGNKNKVSVSFFKTSEFDGSPVEGAIFSLKGVSENGENVSIKSKSSNNGFVEFKGMDPGSYIIQEENAPSGYMRDRSPKIATVNSDGSFEIDGMAKDYDVGGANAYQMKNKKESNSHVVVKKNWDSMAPANVEDLNITLSTSPDCWKMTSTDLVFNSSDGWKFPNGTDVNHVFATGNGDIISGDIVTQPYYGYSVRKDAGPFKKGKVYTVDEIKKLVGDGDLGDEKKIVFDQTLLKATIKINVLELVARAKNRESLHEPKKIVYCYKSSVPEDAIRLREYDNSGIEFENVDYFMYKDVLYVAIKDGYAFGIEEETMSATEFLTKANSMYANFDGLDESQKRDATKFYETFVTGELLQTSPDDTWGVMSPFELFDRSSEHKEEICVEDNIKVYNADFMFYHSAYSEGYLYYHTIVNGIDKLDFSLCNSMRYTFANCYLDSENAKAIKNIDTSKVKDMTRMFCRAYDTSEKGGDLLSGLRFDSAETTNGMFSGFLAKNKDSFKNLDLGSAHNVKDASWMFSETFIVSNGHAFEEEISHIDDKSFLKRFDTKSVKNLDGIFYGSFFNQEDCKNIENWDTSNVENIGHFFSSNKITDVRFIDKWDLSSVKSMSGMFIKTSVKDLSPLKNWDVSKVENMAGMFGGGTSIKDLSPLKNWDVSKVKDMSYMFNNQSIDDLSPLKNWDVSKVENMAGMFYGGTSIKDLSPLKNWDVSKVNNLALMFAGCEELKDLSSIYDWKIGKDCFTACAFKGVDADTPPWYKPDSFLEGL